MNNNETVAVQLEKERPEIFKCNRSSEKYEIQLERKFRHRCPSSGWHLNLFRIAFCQLNLTFGPTEFSSGKSFLSAKCHIQVNSCTELMHTFIKISPQSPGIDTKQLIKELENGYRMEKPNYTANFIGDVMKNCWEKKPKERPTFNQLEETITANLESSVSSYYFNMNAPYKKFNDFAPKSERFGLAIMLNDNPKLMKSLTQSLGIGVRCSLASEPLRLSSQPKISYSALS